MMKIFDDLDDRNFELFAAHHYYSPGAIDIDEFKEDLSRFTYVNRLLRRYHNDGDLQERLILNHLIVISNVFGIPASRRMLWYKVDSEHYKYLKPFLIFLNYLPEEERVEVDIDNYVVERLREI